MLSSSSASLVPDSTLTASSNRSSTRFHPYDDSFVTPHSQLSASLDSSQRLLGKRFSAVQCCHNACFNRLTSEQFHWAREAVRNFDREDQEKFFFQRIGINQANKNKQGEKEILLSDSKGILPLKPRFRYFLMFPPLKQTQENNQEQSNDYQAFQRVSVCRHAFELIHGIGRRRLNEIISSGIKRQNERIEEEQQTNTSNLTNLSSNSLLSSNSPCPELESLFAIPGAIEFKNKNEVSAAGFSLTPEQFYSLLTSNSSNNQALTAALALLQRCDLHE
jgi:hypothetical protein